MLNYTSSARQIGFGNDGESCTSSSRDFLTPPFSGQGDKTKIASMGLIKSALLAAASPHENRIESSFNAADF